MKKTLSIVLIFISAIIFGCTKSDIDIVKKSTLTIDKSLTIGKALESYKYFASKNWILSKDSQGRKIVTFTADMNNEYIKELSNAVNINKNNIPIKKQTWNIVFVVNADNSVSILNTDSVTEYSDGVIDNSKIDNIENTINNGIKLYTIQCVYKNEYCAVISDHDVHVMNKKTSADKTFSGELVTNPKGDSSMIMMQDGSSIYFDSDSEIGSKIWKICENGKKCTVTGTVDKDNNLISLSAVSK